MNYATLGAALVAMLALFSGCGSAEEDSSRTPAAGQVPEVADPTAEPPANPVDVLRKIPGCTLETGAEVGDQDMNGNFYATCELPEVRAHGYVYSPSALARGVDRDLVLATSQDAVPDDSHPVIDGEGFYVVITADPAILAPGMVDLEKIARAVGGTVVPLG